MSSFYFIYKTTKFFFLFDVFKNNHKRMMKRKRKRPTANKSLSFEKKVTGKWRKKFHAMTFARQSSSFRDEHDEKVNIHIHRRPEDKYKKRKRFPFSIDVVNRNSRYCEMGSVMIWTKCCGCLSSSVRVMMKKGK